MSRECWVVVDATGSENSKNVIDIDVALHHAFAGGGTDDDIFGFLGSIVDQLLGASCGKP